MYSHTSRQSSTSLSSSSPAFRTLGFKQMFLSFLTVELPSRQDKSAPCPAPPALAASSANENSLRIYTALTMVLWLQKSDNANSRQESNFQKLFEASTSSFCQSQSPASSFCSTPHLPHLPSTESRKMRQPRNPVNFLLLRRSRLIRRLARSAQRR